MVVTSGVEKVLKIYLGERGLKGDEESEDNIKIFVWIDPISND